MGWIIARLVASGLSEARASKLAPWVAAAAGIALLLALWTLSAPIRGVIDWFDDREAVRQDRIDHNLEQLEGQAEADANAADARVIDTKTQIQQEQDYDDAIHRPRPGDSADPDIRLACEQLRRAGQDTAAVPACGGR